MAMPGRIQLCLLLVVYGLNVSGEQYLAHVLKQGETAYDVAETSLGSAKLVHRLKMDAQGTVDLDPLSVEDGQTIYVPVEFKDLLSLGDELVSKSSTGPRFSTGKRSENRHERANMVSFPAKWAQQSRFPYQVQDNDSLASIALTYLGDGTQFERIVDESGLPVQASSKDLLKKLKIDTVYVPTLEGDIKWTPGQADVVYHRDMDDAHRSAPDQRVLKWTTGIVPYIFEDQFPTEVQDNVRKGMKYISDRVCVTFKPRTNEDDYIKIIRGSGCWSMVGRIRGEQELSIGSGCDGLATVVHELLHACGIQHEQSRPDRDEFVTVNFQNIQEGQEYNFNKYSFSAVDATSTSYDYYSVMHYPKWAFSANGEDTITAKDADFEDVIGQQSGLSTQDIYQMRLIFNCDNSPSPDPDPDSCELSANLFNYDGSVSRTRGNIECQVWNAKFPHVGRYLTSTTHNLCRNPDNDNSGPWCYTTDSEQRWDYCNVGTPANPICSNDDLPAATARPTKKPTFPFVTLKPTKQPTQEPTKKPTSVATGCTYSNDLSTYTGEVSMTETGKSCKVWSSNDPSSSNYNRDVDHNFCRNPDNDPKGSWCYTTVPGVRWEYCNTGTPSNPICTNDELPTPSKSPTATPLTKQPTKAPTTKKPTKAPTPIPTKTPTNQVNILDVECNLGPQYSGYDGTVSKIIKDDTVLTCQRWDATTPHEPNFGRDMAHNYCRNPDGDEWGTWCYTTDPNVRWEYCNVGNMFNTFCNNEQLDAYGPKPPSPPTRRPTKTPTTSPPTTKKPTKAPTTKRPTKQPTPKPTETPTTVTQLSKAPTPQASCSYSANKRNYDGFVSITVDGGRHCQRWDSDFPHKPNFRPQKKDHNYCRNPDGDVGGTWCYTTDPNKRWEYCNTGTPQNPICFNDQLPFTGVPTRNPTFPPTNVPTPQGQTKRPTKEPTRNPTPQPITAGDCVLQSIPQSSDVTRIVGGSDVATPRSFPHQVSIQRNRRHFCGGSLIAPNWVLTAAHCSVRRTDEIVIGAHDLRFTDGCVDRISIAQVIDHPDYTCATDDGKDITVIRLVADSRYPPIAISTGQGENAGQSSQITGWGTLDQGGNSPDILQVAQLPIASQSKCRSVYGSIIDDTLICAGFEEGGVDSCQGDSGGPLFIGSLGNYVQTGITSFGIGCGDPGTPGVYTRVSAYRTWICNTIGGCNT